MSFETKSKIEAFVIILGALLLFTMPILVMSVE
jgi:hypothetical protein